MYLAWILLIIILLYLILVMCILYGTNIKIDTFINTHSPQKFILNYLSPLENIETIPKTNKYIIFQIDCADLNNIRMQYEMLIVLSWLTNRTLVLHPNTTWGSINKVIDVGYIWDLKSMNSVISIMEWSEFVRDKTPKPTLGPSNWDREYNNFFSDVENGVYGSVYEPEWSPGITNFDNEWIKESEDWDILYFYCARVEENESSDTEMKHRMLGNIECYFNHLDDYEKKVMRSIIFQGMKWNREYFEETFDELNRLGLKVGEFNCIHLRNWEGSIGKTQYPQVKEDEIIESIYKKFDIDIPILFLSVNKNNGNMEEFHLNTEYNIVRPTKLDCVYKQSIVEMLMATCSKNFIGTPSSTFSGCIINMRGYLSNFSDKINSEVNFLDGESHNECGTWSFDIIKEERWNLEF